ncbi:SGNH/GDSL hydrolase family protein [Neobacillus niacini]|uniref:SGNH/GDSL hydrolase family protein n=1 Tax=Neobacillus niacini TaxID=86668 RepID=UPI002FFE5CFD
MNKLFVFFMAGMCLVVLFLGHARWKNMSEAAGIEGRKAAEVTLLKEKEERETLINSLRPGNNKPQSLIDFLHYRALTQDKVKITVVGSNVTSGQGASSISTSWPELLKKKLRSENADLESLSLDNHGYEGYSTSDLLNGNKIDLVINGNPDLVIFESSMINNHFRSISIEQTKQDLESIIAILQKELPNAKIYIMSPNPIVNAENKNSIELTYLDYISASEEVIRNNNWLYIDSYREIEKKLNEENILLVDILANDFVNPNDKGNMLWFELLYEYFKKK